MKIPGFLKVELFYLRILTICTVLSTALLIISTVGNTLEGNTWSHRKPPGKKRRVKKESDWKKYYGSCPELKEDIEQFGRQNFSRTILSLHKTPGKTNFEETRQLFVNGVLTESLDNGVPRYYNSNILSRYFRKDYYDGN